VAQASFSRVVPRRRVSRTSSSGRSPRDSSTVTGEPEVGNGVHIDQQLRVRRSFTDEFKGGAVRLWRPTCSIRTSRQRRPISGGWATPPNSSSARAARGTWRRSSAPELRAGSSRGGDPKAAGGSAEAGRYPGVSPVFVAVLRADFGWVAACRRASDPSGARASTSKGSVQRSASPSGRAKKRCQPDLTLAKCSVSYGWQATFAWQLSRRLSAVARRAKADVTPTLEPAHSINRFSSLAGASLHVVESRSLAGDTSYPDGVTLPATALSRSSASSRGPGLNGSCEDGS
jgi:hypothetical protein